MSSNNSTNFNGFSNLTEENKSKVCEIDKQLKVIIPKLSSMSFAQEDYTNFTSLMIERFTLLTGKDWRNCMPAKTKEGDAFIKNMKENFQDLSFYRVDNNQDGMEVRFKDAVTMTITFGPTQDKASVKPPKRLTQDKENDDKKKEGMSTEQIVMLVLAAIFIIALIIVIVMTLKKKNEKPDNPDNPNPDDNTNAQNELDGGHENNNNEVDENNNPVNPNHSETVNEITPSENQVMEDAEGKKIVLSNEVIINEGELSDAAKFATQIENNPNAVCEINGRQCIAPEGYIDADGRRVVAFDDLKSHERIVIPANDVESFTYNGSIVDSNTIDAMCSINATKSGKISFDAFDSIVSINKDTGAFTCTFKTANGTEISKYTYPNISEQDGKYGFLSNDNKTFNVFSDTLQEEIQKTMRDMKNKYPDFDLSSSLKSSKTV